MSAINIMGEDALLFFTTLLAGLFQRSETGKGLSEANFTQEEKTKLASAALVSQLFSGNYADLSGKPTDLSHFANGPGYQTATQVTAAVLSAIGELGGGITLMPVDVLPDIAEAVPNVIYLLARPKGHQQENNLRDEYILLNGAWELIGSTEIDLSGYVQAEDLVPLSNSRIAELVNLALEELS